MKPVKFRRIACLRALMQARENCLPHEAAALSKMIADGMAELGYPLGEGDIDAEAGRRADIKHAARIYAVLEVEDIFAVAADLYIALEDANKALHRPTESMTELAPAVTDWPANLPGALAHARELWEGNEV